MSECLNDKLIIKAGSRASRLAVIQSEYVVRRIEEAFPDVRCETVTMKTTGDRILDRTLDQIGGKGLFVKELDEALLSEACDITVHSLKDLPQLTDERIPLMAFSEREDARDVLVLPPGRTEPDLSLPLGTSSLRRAVQAKELYPGAGTAPVRGNVETRLRKLDEGLYSGLIMAAAGLIRLGLEQRISRFFDPEEMIPAPCQGILGIQARAYRGSAEAEADPERYARDMRISEILAELSDRTSEACAAAERAFVSRVGSDCGSADTAYARIEGESMHVSGLRYDEESGRLIRSSISGKTADAEKLGYELAEKLLAM